MNRLPPILGCVVLGLLLAVSFRVDYKNVVAGGSIDFRNRITGVRLMEARIDPYRYKWRTGEPPEYCDPYNNLALPVSKTTVTPALLLVHLPLSLLSYRDAQIVWLIAQWLLLLGTGFFWLRALPTARERWLWAAMITGFTYTAAWHLHAERGQSYVLLLFVLAWWLVLTRDSPLKNHFWAGLPAGLMIALRPPILLLLAPFLLWRRRGQLAGAAVGILIGAGLPLILSSTCWSEYNSGMKTWSDLYRHGIDPIPPVQAFPAVVDDLSIDVLGAFAPIPFADGSLYYLLRSWSIAPLPDLPVLLAYALLVALWYWKARSQSENVLLLGIAAWSFLADLFIPALRNSYNDVLIFNAIALALLAPPRLSWIVWPCLLLGLPLGWSIYALVPRDAWVIDLPCITFAAVSVLCLVLPLWPPAHALPSPAVLPKARRKAAR